MAGFNRKCVNWVNETEETEKTGKLYEAKTKMSASLQKEMDNLVDEIDDFMGNAEMIVDSMGGKERMADINPGQKYMKNAFLSMDKVYEQFKAKMRVFVKAQQKFND